jgi:adenosylmethionine-8-amino-7-oxononanoate transaminase
MKPLTRRLAGLDARYVWHPFTQMSEWTPRGMIVAASGKGPWLIDTDGRRWFDGVSSLWCNVHGHRVPEIDRAVARQLGRVAHSTFLGLSNAPAVELARRLVELAPRGLARVFYSDSGSEAVEVALKMAFQYWSHRGRPEKCTFLNFTNAYHGDTIGAVSVGGIGLFHGIFRPLLFRTVTARAPYRYRDGFRGSERAYLRFCVDRVERVLRRHAPRIAAIVMEPLVQGAAGMITHPRGFLAAVRRLADRYGTLLILDEVATGFGRTGRMFACEHEKVRPDILCLAKGLTGGYLPLAATLTTEEIYRAFLGRYDEFKAFFHGHTYTANPLACAAALGSLEVFRRRRVLAGLAPKIRRFKAELERFRALEHVGDVRQVGLMAGVEFVRDRRTRAPFPLAEKRGIRACLAARKHGILVRPLGNVVVLMPPLASSEREIVRFCRAMFAAVREATER